MDIPCLNSSLVHSQIPFCAEYVSYDIDKRLNFVALDSLATQQLEVFNKTKPSETCYKYRKALTCVMAFPRCSTTAFAEFPCRDLCYGYYNQCGAPAHNSTCNAFPTVDCESPVVVAKSSASLTHVPVIMIALLVMTMYI